MSRRVIGNGPKQGRASTGNELISGGHTFYPSTPLMDHRVKHI